jgi:amino-acid N-acetyltransferase
MNTPTLPPLRPARAEDYEAVARLLEASALPTAGVRELFETRASDFIVADDGGGELLGVAGLEVCCDNALLRSVAVRPDWQKHGLGRELVRRIVCDAEERGIRALYLLTMTAEHYFPRLGFERIERGEVPTDIGETLEFKSACPASATVMSRALARAHTHAEVC